MRFSRNVLPADGEFTEFRKVATTRMARIVGPFEVETREGLLFCPDGWLAIDGGGWPYPIAEDEQARIYQPVIDDGAVREH